MRIEILFAEWIAENHYRLMDVRNCIHYWENEDYVKTTNELFDLFCEEMNIEVTKF